MRIPGAAAAGRTMAAASERVSKSKTLRHVLAAVLGCSFGMLILGTLALFALVWYGKIDLANGTTIGGALTIFSGLAVLAIRLLAGAERAVAPGEAGDAGPATEPPRAA